MYWQRLRAITWKEIIHIKRDVPSLVIIFVMPLLLLLLFGYAVRTDVEHISTAVYNQDPGKLSRELLRVFDNSGYFDLKFYPRDGEELEKVIAGGQAKAGILIPADYSQCIRRGETGTIQLVIDGSEPGTARTALYAAQVLAQVKSAQLRTTAMAGKTPPSGPSLEIRPRVWYNPDLESTRFNIPGLIGLIMQNVTLMLTAFTLVREKEKGTMEQLIVTPVKPVELVLGKLAPYSIIGLVDVTVVLLVGSLWFQVPVSGSISLLMALAALFLVCVLGLGLFISTIAQTQLQAMQAALLILLPSVLLSGFMFPREAMPTFVQLLGNLIPLTYFLTILRGIILKGNGWDQLWPQACCLAAFAGVILGLAVFRLRKKN